MPRDSATMTSLGAVGRPAPGFQPVCSAVRSVVDRVAEAAIEQALAGGDTAKATRMRGMLREFQEGRNAS